MIARKALWDVHCLAILTLTVCWQIALAVLHLSVGPGINVSKQPDAIYIVVMLVGNALGINRDVHADGQSSRLTAQMAAVCTMQLESTQCKMLNCHVAHTCHTF